MPNANHGIRARHAGLFTVLVFHLVMMAAASDQGQITLTIDGVDAHYQIVALNESVGFVNVSGRSLTLQHGNVSDQGTRIWVAKDGSMAPDSYAQFPLLGKTLTYTIDLADVGCSCNAALYWVSMPGYGANGQPAPSEKGNFYCDANKVWGTWCWEMDTFEGNQHTMAVTPHTCSSPPGMAISSCDRAGAGRNSWLANRHGICPEDRCIIDTRKPFRHEQSFVTDVTGKVLLRITNTMRQGSRVFVFNGTKDQEYLGKMSTALEHGMVLTFQLWGGSWLLMSWLDFMTGCWGACPHSSVVTYSNISLAAIES